jgi:hypothetical protein
MSALLLLGQPARTADVDALVEALGPRLAELALTTSEADWATATSKENLAKFYGLPWPLPETKLTREKLEQKVKELERSVPEVPDDAKLAALLDEKFPLLKVGDSIEFTAMKAGKEQHVKGEITSIRAARDLAGGGKLEAAIEIDGDAIWKRDELSDETKARLFAVDREEWTRQTIPALKARVEAHCQGALAALPERIRQLLDASGYVLAPTAPRVPENTVLTGTETGDILDGLTWFARVNKAQIYANAAHLAAMAAADDAIRRRREAEERARLLERQQRMDAASRDLAVQWATEARAAGTVQSQSLQDQMRSGTVVVPGWARRSRQDMQGFLDVVNEATVGR